MKRLIIILLALIIIVAGLVLVFNKRIQAPAGPPSDSVPSSEIKPAEVIIHNSVTDCWVAIGGSVYRLDNYFVKNPDSLLASQLCGKLEPDVKLPKTLKTDSLITYRIGILGL